MTQNFEAKLHRPEGKGTWTYVTMPFNVEIVFGTRSCVPVTGVIDGQSFQGSLLPHGNSQHILVVNKELRDQIGKQSGDFVKVELQRDEAPRTVTLPEELLDKLNNNPDAQAAFKEFSYSHQKEFTEWVRSAKKASTRERRASKVIDMISSGMRLKS